MKLHPCGCGDAHYVRAPREWWMKKLSRNRRLFVCDQCKARMFLRMVDVAPEARHRFESGNLGGVHASAVSAAKARAD